MVCFIAQVYLFWWSICSQKFQFSTHGFLCRFSVFLSANHGGKCILHTCITNSASFQRSNTCITVENSNVWVSSELVTITSTSPNIILIYISNFVTLFNKLPSGWIYKYMYIRLSLLLQVHWAMIDSITSDCGVIIWPITTS